MPANAREKKRDDRDYDTTQLHEAGHGKTLGRDYSAHFFRWSFARRFITIADNVLEIGCGEDKPLAKVLTGGAAAHVKHYTGVDLNKLKPSQSQRLTFLGEFNFVERYKELLTGDHKKGFDVIVHLECVEHMKKAHGIKLLKACFESLRPGGIMLMSTPCYDGVRHAANHVWEWLVPELQEETERAGFIVERRFGTFADIKEFRRNVPHLQLKPGEKPSKEDLERQKKLSEAVSILLPQLEQYYDNDAISCLFAPLFPDTSRNNLWITRKPGGAPRPVGKSIAPTKTLLPPRPPPGPTSPRESASTLFKSLIMEGKLTDDQIFAEVQKKFGLPDKRRSYVGAYRSILRKEGQNAPGPVLI